MTSTTREVSARTEHYSRPTFYRGRRRMRTVYTTVGAVAFAVAAASAVVLGFIAAVVIGTR